MADALGRSFGEATCPVCLVADNGQHTWANVALAHFACNAKRGAIGPAQLRLAS